MVIPIIINNYIEVDKMNGNTNNKSDCAKDSKLNSIQKWNIVFDINQKVLEQEFYKKESEPVNCSIQTIDTEFSDVFDTEKKVTIVIM